MKFSVLKTKILKQNSSKLFSTNSSKLKWNLQSVWPKNLVNNEVVIKFKECLEKISDTQWTINTTFGVNKDLAFENIKNKKTDIIIGHSTYWNNMKPAASCFASMPFGMSASEYLSWIHFGGGRKYWELLYEPLNLYPLLAGDTGAQMGGWFPKRMNSTKDFKDLKMRIEGLGGPIIEKYGAKLVNAPASKLVSMIESGELDACEFATPVMDEAAGLDKTKKKLYFHYPGWHQPSAVFEFLINKDIYNTLSEQQKAMLDAASLQASMHFTLHLQSENELVLEKMMRAGVELHVFPDEMLKDLKETTKIVVEEVMKTDNFSYEVYKSYQSFLERMSLWGPMSGSALWKWRK